MSALVDLTFKKVDTVGDLIKFLEKVRPTTKVTMFSDEEGNQVNKILCLELDENGLVIIPWEDFTE